MWPSLVLYLSILLSPCRTRPAWNCRPPRIDEGTGRTSSYLLLLYPSQHLLRRLSSTPLVVVDQPVLHYVNNSPKTLAEDTCITQQYARVFTEALDLGFKEPHIIPISTTKGDLLVVYDNKECPPNSLITMWVDPPTPPPLHPLDWMECLQNIAKDIQDHNDYKPATCITLWHKPAKCKTTNNAKDQDSNDDDDQDIGSAY